MKIIDLTPSTDNRTEAKALVNSAINCITIQQSGHFIQIDIKQFDTLSKAIRREFVL